MIVINEATTADAADLHQLAALTFPLACPPHTSADSIAAFITKHLSEPAFGRYLADPDRDLLIARDGGNVVGYAMLVHAEPTDQDVAAVITTRPTTELSKLYVHPDHHGAGVAAALVTRSIAAAQQRGSKTVWLGVNQLNARANRFYAKSGFAQVGTKTFQVGDQIEQDFVRERQL